MISPAITFLLLATNGSIFVFAAAIGGLGFTAVSRALTNLATDPGKSKKSFFFLNFF
jgi:hypothetical protein